MSQLVALSHTIVDSIPLGRRIEEIMKENGMYYSIAAMSNRIGMGRETLRLMLKGTREIYIFELEKIVRDLKISLDRVLQKDICSEMDELDNLFRRETNLERAFELAIRMEEVAVGITERSKAYNNVGRILYLQRDYKKAHEKWLEAYEYAQEVFERYDDSEILFHITSNLLLTYTIRREFSQISNLIGKVENSLGSHPHISAKICYTLAEVLEKIGDVENAGKNYRKSLAFFEQTGNPIWIAKAKHNLACYEFRQRNYLESELLFQSAITSFEGDRYNYLVCVKEYSKTLLKLGQNSDVIKMVEEVLQTIDASDLRWAAILKAKFYLLKSRAGNDPTFADQVLNMVDVPANIRSIAGEFLMNYYEEKNDSTMLIKYYRDVKGISSRGFDILDKEEF